MALFPLILPALHAMQIGPEAEVARLLAAIDALDEEPVGGMPDLGPINHAVPASGPIARPQQPSPNAASAAIIHAQQAPPVTSPLRTTQQMQETYAAQILEALDALEKEPEEPITIPNRRTTRPEAPAAQPAAQPEQPSASTASAALVITPHMRNTQQMKEALSHSHTMLNNIAQTFYSFEKQLAEQLTPYNTGIPENGLLHTINQLKAAIMTHKTGKYAEYRAALEKGLVQVIQLFHNQMTPVIEAIPQYKLQIDILNRCIQENIRTLENLRNRGSRYSLEPGEPLPNNDRSVTREAIKFLTLIQRETKIIQIALDAAQSEFLTLQKALDPTEIQLMLNQIDNLQDISEYIQKGWCRSVLGRVTNLYSHGHFSDPSAQQLPELLSKLGQNIDSSRHRFTEIAKKFRAAEQRHFGIQTDLGMFFSILDIGADEEKSKSFNIAYFDAIEKRFAMSILFGEIRTLFCRAILPSLSSTSLISKDGGLLKVLNILSYLPSIENFIGQSTDFDEYIRSKNFGALKDLAQKLAMPVSDVLRTIFAAEGQATQEQLFPEVRRLLDELLPQLGSIVQQDLHAEQGEFDDLMQHPETLGDWFTNKVMQTEDRGCILYDLLCLSCLPFGRTAPLVRQLLKSSPAIEHYFDTYVKKLADPSWALVEWGDFLLRVSKWLPLCVPVGAVQLGEWFVAKSSPTLLRAQPQAQAQTVSTQERSASLAGRTIRNAIGIATGGAQQVGNVIARGARIFAGPIIHQTRIAQFLNTANTRASNAWNSTLDFTYRKFFGRDNATNWRPQNSPENRLGLKFLIMRVLYNGLCKCGAQKTFIDLEQGLINNEPESEDVRKLIRPIKRYNLYPFVLPFTALMADYSPQVRHYAQRFINPNQVDPIDRLESAQEASAGATGKPRRIISQAIQDPQLRTFLGECKRGFDGLASNSERLIRHEAATL